MAFAATMYPSAYYGVIGVLIIFATTMILVLLLTNKVSSKDQSHIGTTAVITTQVNSFNISFINKAMFEGVACPKLLFKIRRERRG